MSACVYLFLYVSSGATHLLPEDGWDKLQTLTLSAHYVHWINPCQCLSYPYQGFVCQGLRLQISNLSQQYSGGNIELFTLSNYVHNIWNDVHCCQTITWVISFLLFPHLQYWYVPFRNLVTAQHLFLFYHCWLWWFNFNSFDSSLTYIYSCSHGAVAFITSPPLPLFSLSLSFSCHVSGCCCLITHNQKLKTSKGETIYNHHNLNLLCVIHCVLLLLCSVRTSQKSFRLCIRS